MANGEDNNFAPMVIWNYANWELWKLGKMVIRNNGKILNDGKDDRKL